MGASGALRSEALYICSDSILDTREYIRNASYSSQLLPSVDSLP